MLETVAKPGTRKEQIAPKFHQLLQQNFATDIIGRFVLGTYWKKASHEQKKEYMKLLEDMITLTYSDRFSNYSGERFAVIDARPEGKADYTVNSEIIRTNGAVIDVGWRVRKRDSKLKIIDVTVEGISMSASQRAEFASIIQSGGGIEGLLQTMRERVGAIGGKTR